MRTYEVKIKERGGGGWPFCILVYAIDWCGAASEAITLLLQLPAPESQLWIGHNGRGAHVYGCGIELSIREVRRRPYADHVVDGIDREPNAVGFASSVLSGNSMRMGSVASAQPPAVSLHSMCVHQQGLSRQSFLQSDDYSADHMIGQARSSPTQVRAVRPFPDAFRRAFDEALQSRREMPVGHLIDELVSAIHQEGSSDIVLFVTPEQEGHSGRVLAACGMHAEQIIMASLTWSEFMHVQVMTRARRNGPNRTPSTLALTTMEGVELQLKVADAMVEPVRSDHLVAAWICLLQTQGGEGFSPKHHRLVRSLVVDCVQPLLRDWF